MSNPRHVLHDEFCPYLEHNWAIVQVEPIHIYIAFNVGRECWTVLTPNFHTLKHVSQIENQSLITQKNCKTNCKYCRDYLVPRVRPSGIPLNAQTWRFWSSDREEAKEFLKNSEEAIPIMKESVYFYLDRIYKSGYCLLTGFDFDAKKHLAVWRQSNSQSVSVVEKDELRVREFLVAMRPHFKNLKKAERKEFL